jgi:hypothetical protein
LGEDIRGGLLYAAGFSILAVVIIAVAGVGTLVGAQQVTGWSQLPLGLPLIIAGYFIAGTLGGFAYWLLRPMRRWLLGWMLTGFVISALTYGAVGVTGVLGYYVGANILDLDSVAEGWGLIPWLSLLTGVFPGIPLGIYYWHKNR